MSENSENIQPERGEVREGNQYLQEVKDFIRDRSPDKLIVIIGDGYRGYRWRQGFQILDFKTLESKNINENLPPGTGTQTQWNEAEAYLGSLEVPDPSRQILNEDYQYGNREFGGRHIAGSISSLHSGLQSLHRLKSELETIDKREDQEKIRKNIADIEKKNRRLISSLSEAGYELPFELK